MAESRGTNIAKLVTKQAGRAKEKLLQNMGRADKTTDEIFDEHLNNFNIQQSQAIRMQKDVANYIRCIRAVQMASKNLMDTIGEVYDHEWVGSDQIYLQAQNLDMLWSVLGHKISDQVFLPLSTYASQFPDIKKKVEKRGRKLIDFDKERHMVQTLQSNPSRNEAKFARAKEHMESARRTYEVLNSELHEELPSLFESRILFFVTSMQSLFASQEVFHSDIAKVHNDLEEVVDNLAKEVQKGSLPRKQITSKLPPPSSNHLTNSNSANSIIPMFNQNKHSSKAQYNGGASLKRSSSSKRSDSSKFYSDNSDLRTNMQLHENRNSNNSIASLNGINSTSFSNVPNTTANKQTVIPIGATTDNMPNGVLYKVKSTYKYQAEDGDELSFEVGEIVQVIEFDEPEEQEDGWLMGIKESTGQKGLFPANFTCPI